MRSLDENRAKTRLPSLAGVGAATQVLLCAIVRPVAQNCRSQSSAPSVLEKHITCRRSCSGPLEQVTNTRSPTTIGPDSPRPGRGIFQAMLFSSSSTGRRASAATAALESLPRNCSQSARATAGISAISVRWVRSARWVIGSSLIWSRRCWRAEQGGARSVLLVWQGGFSLALPSRQHRRRAFESSTARSIPRSVRSGRP